MRKVTFSVTPSGAIEPPRFSIGHVGEHNATTLVITLPEELCSAAEYFRLAIGSYQTEQLYPTGNTLSYTVPQCILIGGTQFLQVEGYKHSGEGELLLIFKSDIGIVEVLPSVDPYSETTDEVLCEVDGALGKLHYYVTKSDELSAELKSTAEECASILEEAKETLDGKADKEYVDNITGDIETVLDKKADKATTLAGYGITDACTQELAFYIQSDCNSYTEELSSKAFVTYEYDGSTTFLDVYNKERYVFTTPVHSLELSYPSGDFILSLEFTVSDEGFTLILPNSRYIGGVPTFAPGETWELNIMNGVVVGGLVE